MDKQNKESIVFSEYINTISNLNTSTKDQEESLNYFVTESIKVKEANTTFMIDEVISDSILRLSRIKAPRGIQILFEMNHDSIVYARRDMICCMVRNLIVNIIKFGSNGEKIKISSDTVQDKVRTSISISGGITNKNDFYELFQEHENISNPNKIDEIIARIELLLCRQFTEANNTNLSVVYREEEQDLLFTFSLSKAIMSIYDCRIKSNSPVNKLIHWHSSF
ncbi:HAMP domain-containing histidine kinase [Pseudanabaena sp. BC1403]|uniref:HAMP domain-containing histidine kinase n=1 Tax=Pseudanabaena sp. BC1403 TaxID=2043171 RepID=UPI000CD9C1BC|nr:HAMP domain-containing histidine kinase [Pseudanabaena sp. BC1403]